jgi:undecaprenyl-diphosphatase
VRHCLSLLAFLGFAWSGLASVPPAATTLSQGSSAATPVAELSVSDAIVLGVVEGVTEFLPISSTGHLIVANQLLGLESDKPLFGSNGQPLWFKKPSLKNPAGEPFTVALAANTYCIVIQFGAIAAVALLYWSQMLAMGRGLFGRDPAGLRLLINLIVAFLPAAVVGLLAHDWIDRNLFSIGAVIAAQIVGAGLMFYAEYWRRRRAARQPGRPEPVELTPRQAVGIGALQCVAMWPGTSRSMMCIVGGYFAGFEPRRAAEFSFLLGFVTLAAATAFKSYQSGAVMIRVFGWSHVLLGCVVAAVTAAIAVKFLVHFLSRHGLAAFAVYRLALAAVLAGWFLR